MYFYKIMTPTSILSSSSGDPGGTPGVEDPPISTSEPDESFRFLFFIFFRKVAGGLQENNKEV